MIDRSPAKRMPSLSDVTHPGKFGVYLHSGWIKNIAKYINKYIRHRNHSIFFTERVFQLGAPRKMMEGKGIKLFPGGARHRRWNGWLWVGVLWRYRGAAGKQNTIAPRDVALSGLAQVSAGPSG